MSIRQAFTLFALAMLPWDAFYLAHAHTLISITWYVVWAILFARRAANGIVSWSADAPQDEEGDFE